LRLVTCAAFLTTPPDARRERGEVDRVTAQDAPSAQRDTSPGMSTTAVVRRRNRHAAAILALVVALAGAGWVAADQPALAIDLDDPYSIYFPWVPNNETIGGQGPFYGAISVSNLSDNSCAVRINVGEIASWTERGQITLLGGESRHMRASTFNLPTPGAAMRLDAQCPIVASVKYHAPNVAELPWSDGSQVVTGYTGLSETDLAAAHATPASAWFLPIVQTNTGWNTFIRVTNLSRLAGADVRIELYSSGNPHGAAGAILVQKRTLAIGETWTVDVQQSLGFTGWVGFARITSSGDIGVIAARGKASATMALTNVAIAADGAAPAGSYRTVAPLLFTAYNGWNTGINLANVSEVDASVTVQYYAAGGGMLRENTLVIPARGMQYIYTPGNVQEEGFVGGAIILSDRPVVGAIDEVKYETVEGLSYMASGIAQHDASLPAVFKGDPANGRHDNSGINIHNLDPDAEQTVLVRLVKRDRQQVIDLLPVPLSVTLPPGGNNFVYVPFVADIPPGTVAAAILTSQNPNGFVAISNDINYAVGGDGSLAYAASGNGGIYYVPGPPAP
jgi:hypothetical protein